MLSSVSSVVTRQAENLYNQTKEVISNPSIIIENITKIAVPLIGIIFISNMPSAEAGPITYAACYAACNAAVAAGTLTPAGVVVCFEACLPLAGPWCP